MLRMIKSLFLEYAQSLGVGEVLVELVVPIGVFALFCSPLLGRAEISPDFIYSLVETLGVLAGLGLTATTVIATADNQKVSALKAKPLENAAKSGSVFDRVFMLVSFSVVIALLSILVGTATLLCDPSGHDSSWMWRCLSAVTLAMSMQTLLLYFRVSIVLFGFFRG